MLYFNVWHITCSNLIVIECHLKKKMYIPRNKINQHIHFSFWFPIEIYFKCEGIFDDAEEGKRRE